MKQDLAHIKFSKTKTWHAMSLLRSCLAVFFVVLGSEVLHAAPRIIEPVIIPATVPTAPTQPEPEKTAQPVADSQPPAAPVQSELPAVAVVPPAVVPVPPANPSAPVAPVAPVAVPPATGAPQVPTAAGTVPLTIPPVEATAPLEPEFAFASRSTRYVAAPETATSAFSSPILDPEVAVEREEMYARMRLAVEKISAEYGNPSFAQVFTNDPVRARVLRNRLKMLQNYEALQAEVARLDKERVAASQAVDEASRLRMAQIQAEIASLERQKVMVAQSFEAAVQQQRAAVAAAVSVLEHDKNILTSDVAAKRAELQSLQAEAESLNQRIRKAQSVLTASGQ